MAHLADLLDTLRVNLAGGADVLCGHWQGHEVYVLVSRSAAGTLFFVEHPGDLPGLVIEPRGPGWNTDLVRGSRQVELDSAAFAKAFIVRSRTPKLAYDICHPRMVEYLLATGDVAVHIVGNCLALRGRHKDDCDSDIEDIPKRLTQLVEIRKLMPEFVFQTEYEGT
jgi:hypothetical protein